jgi:protein-tyrosine-phosphatase
MKPRLVFVGSTGGARAPIAAALARALAGENATAACAAFLPGDVHPLALQAMAERGLVPPAARPGALASLFENCDYFVLLCHEAAELPLFQPASTAAAHSGKCANAAGPERLDWRTANPLLETADQAARLSRLRAFRDDMERKLMSWLGNRNLLAADNAPLQRVWRELARYEHPLFAWEAVPSGENVEVQIRFKDPSPLLDGYAFQLRPRELENRQFPWLFQKQLYDCLHDYVIELFSRNPQQDES